MEAILGIAALGVAGTVWMHMSGEARTGKIFAVAMGVLVVMMSMSDANATNFLDPNWKPMSTERTLEDNLERQKVGNRYPEPTYRGRTIEELVKEACATGAIDCSGRKPARKSTGGFYIEGDGCTVDGCEYYYIRRN